MKNSLSTTIILILLGILISSLIFAINLKFLLELGVWTSILSFSLLITVGFKYTKKEKPIRVVIWTLLVCLVLSTIGFIVGLNLLSSALDGF